MNALEDMILWPVHRADSLRFLSNLANHFTCLAFFLHFAFCLALGLEELGRQVVIELMQDWLSPLLTGVEQDRLLGWHLGVNL